MKILYANVIKSRRILNIVIVSHILVILGLTLYPPLQPVKQIKQIYAALNPKVFTLGELAKYNAEDPALPVYMGLDGKVYDVTSGKKYYLPGTAYHYLVGRDSSADLHAVSVDGLIKSKYPVAGTLMK